MNALSPPTRRTLLQGAGSLVVAFTFARGRAAQAQTPVTAGPGDIALTETDSAAVYGANAFVRIDPTGPVRLIMPFVEMGQGAYTGAATLLSEELGLGLDQVVLEHAPPDALAYTNPLLAQQATGGSTSMRAGWQVLRTAGATVRTMLVTAAARQWGVDPMTCTVERGSVHHAPSGREVSFGDLAGAAAAEPVPTKVTLKDPKDFQLIGKPFRRLDTAGKVDGSILFGIDVRVPDMRIASVVSCPTIGGTLRSVDETHARAIPGVRDIVHLPDAVAVIGDNFWAAKSGAEALLVDWDRGALAGFSSADLVAAMDHSSQTGTAIVARQVGDIAQTGTRVEAIYQLPILAHAPMEPLNAVVHVRADACEIWVGTQVPTRCVDVAAAITGLPKNRIIVHNHYLGGGFGRRLDVDSVQQAVSIAKAVSYPVKLIWTREYDIQHDIPRPPYFDRIAATLDVNGIPVAWNDRVTGASVLRRWAPAGLLKNGLDPDTVEGAAEPPYDLPNLKVEWVRHDMPAALPIGWWRGVGPTHNLFKVESFIDELAHKAGRDPVDYRRALLHKDRRTLAVLNLAAEKFGWSTAAVGPRRGRGVAIGAPFGSYICAMVEVEVSPEGEIHLRRSVTAVDCGIAINPNTVEAQVQGGLVFGWTGALYSQITLQDGAVQQSNFNDYRMMRMDETPALEVHILASGDPPGGLGEVGTAIAAPALTNAIFAATGVRIRSLPIDRALLVEQVQS